MTNKIIWKFFASFILLILIVVAVLGFLVSLKLRDNFEQKITDRLRSNAVLVGDLTKQDLGEHDREAIQGKVVRLAQRVNLRITVIDPQGVVLGDSEKAPALMENHRNRSEIAQALKYGFGQSTRFSETLKYHMKYVAVRVAEGDRVYGVVRFALPLSEVQLEMRTVHRGALLGVIAAVIVGLAVAYLLARSISNPIRDMKEIAHRLAEGDFGKKIRTERKDELGELAESLNSMADELQSKIENLRRLDRIRTDFVANVSHELKTPLTSIKGFVETLEDGAINDRETAERFISITGKHVRRLENIINDLLTLAELEQEDGRLERARFDLRALVDEVALGFGHALATRRQQLSIGAEGDDFIIRADRDKIEQIFVNLLDNAIKYTAEGGQIKIMLCEQQTEVLVTVEDDGIGIAPEHLERVFERFYRVDKARSRELGGTGLGLGIAKHIVLAHNGTISIESEVNNGTKVFVTLPKE